MLAELIAEQAATVDVHAFTQDFIQAFANDDRTIDTSTCYEALVQVEDEITREDGIADCLAPTLSIQIADELFSEEDEDRTVSRVASGIWFLGAALPDIALAYRECEDLNNDVQRLMTLYNNHFKDAFASLYSFAAILSVVQAYEGQIMEFTNEYGSGKNAAEIALIVEQHFPHVPSEALM